MRSVSCAIEACQGNGEQPTRMRFETEMFCLSKDA